MTTAMPRFVLFSISALCLFLLFGGIPGSFAAEEYQQVGLAEHNKFRAQHDDTPMMKLDEELNANAVKCAYYYANDLGTIDHSCPYKSGSGENLGMGWGEKPTSVQAVTKHITNWYGEIKDWDFDKASWKAGKGFRNVGHFTQVVWAKSVKLGMGFTVNKDGKFFVVGLYSPHGNFNNLYKENVHKLCANCPSPPPPPPQSSGGINNDGRGGEEGNSTSSAIPKGANKMTFFGPTWAHFIFTALLLFVGIVV